jgi:putative ABC transport system ATP-binding protein
MAGHSTEILSRGQRPAIRNRYAGFVFRRLTVVADVTILENVELPLTFLQFHKRTSKSDFNTRVSARRCGSAPASASDRDIRLAATARCRCTGVGGRSRPAVGSRAHLTRNLISRIGDAVFELLNALHATCSTISMITRDATRRGPWRLCAGRTARSIHHRAETWS